MTRKATCASHTTTCWRVCTYSRTPNRRSPPLIPDGETVHIGPTSAFAWYGWKPVPRPH